MSARAPHINRQLIENDPVPSKMKTIALVSVIDLLFESPWRKNNVLAISPQLVIGSSFSS